MGKPKKKKGKMSQAVVRENIQLLTDASGLSSDYCFLLWTDVRPCDLVSGLYARFSFLG